MMRSSAKHGNKFEGQSQEQLKPNVFFTNMQGGQARSVHIPPSQMQHLIKVVNDELNCNAGMSRTDFQLHPSSSFT
jgi:hypothetical protein